MQLTHESPHRLNRHHLRTDKPACMQSSILVARPTWLPF